MSYPFGPVTKNSWNHIRVKYALKISQIAATFQLVWSIAPLSQKVTLADINYKKGPNIHAIKCSLVCSVVVCVGGVSDDVDDGVVGCEQT